MLISLNIRGLLPVSFSFIKSSLILIKGSFISSNVVLERLIGLLGADETEEAAGEWRVSKEMKVLEKLGESKVWHAAA